MRILATVIARRASKRLPGKNLRLLDGRPLTVWSIDVARDHPTICDVLVSTDDPAIAEVARKAGALVPWLRPDKLSTDSARNGPVAVHALDWYEANRGTVDGVLCLQPTSPFRSARTVDRGIELFRRHDRRPVIGVGPAKSHPMWCYRLVEDTMRPFVDSEGIQHRSQDLPPAYVVNGAFYLSSTEDLRRRQSFFTNIMTPLVIEKPEESIDIDTEWDWMVAEAFIRERNSIVEDCATETAGPSGESR